MNIAMRRAVALAGLSGAAVLAAAVPAFAHVSVQPGTAAKGSYSTVAFKVPNEEDKASTIKVEVNLPADHPIASVSLQPVPGWTAQVVKSKLAKPITSDDGSITEAVTKITWTGGKIAPGEFQQFPVSFGPLPEDADQLVFKAVQTYDNKDVVRWIEEQQEGQAEPEHPAPVLTLSDDADGGHGHGAASSPSPVADTEAGGDGKSATTEKAASADSSDTTARVLGVVGIVVGVLGVGFGVLAGRRRGAGGGTPAV
ncbi:YcnI family protein [Streptomyces sp. MI02-7b]|uniref:YcnI family protein n=1 Tax=Streptomyces sp. MI02-7b TaxID=462941 RepID=UPI0029BBA0CB|nr:YcnI family protein [Streptomyces sp. MI02-7b]MDX3076435.1 YcnI family protein [Streptomyces sp. MI02-7b]